MEQHIAERAVEYLNDMDLQEEKPCEVLESVMRIGTGINFGIVGKNVLAIGWALKCVNDDEDAYFAVERLMVDSYGLSMVVW